MAFNIWQNFTSEGILNYALSAYGSLDIWLWPLIFLGIFGYIYAGTKSIVVCVVGIIITFGVFAGTTDVFNRVPEPTMVAYIVVIMGLSMLFAGLFIKISNKF